MTLNTMRPDARFDDELLAEYKQTGNPAARATLIERYVPLVRSVAWRFRSSGEPIEDLVQAGAVGLIKAVDRYDPAHDVPLPGYAFPMILGEIKRHLRDCSWAIGVPRRVKELAVKMSGLEEAVTAELGRAPTVEELAAAAGVGVEDALEARVARRAARETAFGSTEGDGEDAPEPLDTVGETDAGYELVEDLDALAAGLRTLDARERVIMKLRFFDGLTQSQIATEVGVSQMHVSRILRRSLDKVAAAAASRLAA